MDGNALMLFALNSSHAFGEQVGQHLGLALSGHEEREFEDGEHETRPLCSVRGRDVFIIQSLYADHQLSGNDKLCRLLFFVGALKDAGAARVSVVAPYLAYARKDRKTKPRDPVTTRYIATLFEAVGTDTLVTLDVHNVAAFQNAFRCGAEHLEGGRMFSHYFAPLLQGREVVVVAPDAGGIKRAERFRRLLSQLREKPVGLAFAEKHRSGGIVGGDLLVGEVKGKDVVIIDDLISTGTTVMRTATACHALGAARAFAVATHGLFTGDANTILADAALERIVIADTVAPFRLVEGALKAKVTVLSCAALFAEAIRRLHVGGSITDLLEP